MDYYKQVLTFAHHHVAPYTTEVDKQGRFPHEAFDALKNQGYMGLLVPRCYGGDEKTLFEHVQTCMALAQSCATTALCYMMHNVATMSLIAYATDEQKKFYLPKIASGEITLALAFSETGTGTHFYNPEIDVTLHDGTYYLNGKKSFVTAAQEANYYLILTKNPLNEGLSVFITPSKDTNIRHEPQAWDGLGMRGNNSMPVYYENYCCSQEHVVGNHGDGVGIVFTIVAPFFISGLAAVYSGLGIHASSYAIDYAQQRSYSSGELLSHIPTIQHHLSTLYTLAQNSVALTLAAAQAACRNDEEALTLIIAARINASENSVKICTEAMKVGGGQAYAKRLPLERFLRDAYAANIMAPSCDVLSLWLGKALTKQQIP